MYGVFGLNTNVSLCAQTEGIGRMSLAFSFWYVSNLLNIVTGVGWKYAGRDAYFVTTDFSEEMFTRIHCCCGECIWKFQFVHKFGHDSPDLQKNFDANTDHQTIEWLLVKLHRNKISKFNIFSIICNTKLCSWWKLAN